MADLLVSRKVSNQLQGNLYGNFVPGVNYCGVGVLVFGFTWGYVVS